MSEVSGNRPERPPAKIKPGNWKNLGMTMVKYTHADRVECLCGWSAIHRRAKVLEDKIDRHLAKRHAGRGVRL